MHAIQVDHVVKRYKNGVQALNGLSLSVKEGEIFSLVSFFRMKWFMKR